MNNIGNNPNSIYPKLYTTNYFCIIPMFIVAFLQFLMVRIIDEFKDYEEDCKYRSYRPVPRGLITLKELKILFIICLIIQFGITFFWKSGALSPITQIVWLVFLLAYFFIMSKGYFIKRFIDKHLLFEVLLDELMMPIMVMYLASFVYDVNIILMIPLLIMSYIISWIVEIARKVRCKEDEEKGVKTYTAVFGIKKAMLILFILETILMIVHTVILGKHYLVLTIILYLICCIINMLFIKKQNRRFAKLTELSANMYIFIVYFSMILLII
jgi:4-hydroxybenzoate polyprenyltransferase